MKNDGGPAFPGKYVSKHIGQDWVEGMSLRDWFAGQALNGMLSNPQTERDTLDVVFAESAYALADAMLTEREKGNDTPG